MEDPEIVKMTLQEITFYYGIRKKTLAVALEYTFGDLNSGAALTGRFTVPKPEYSELLDPSKIGRVSAILDWNRSYLLLNLESDGRFSLEPAAQYREARTKAAAGLRS